MILRRIHTTMPSLFLFLLALLSTAAWADDIIKTDGFSTCSTNTDVQVQRMNIQYNKATNMVTFDVAGTSASEQKVMANLVVTAYGKQVYQREFNPCDHDITQLCPLPRGNFSAQGEQSIPQEYLDKIPSIAFSIPNLDGLAKLELKSLTDDSTIACIQSTVDNGKSVRVPAVSYVSVGIVGGALLCSAFSALDASGTPGAPTPSPSFAEVAGWLQGIAMNGMMSVNYPSVYRSFTQNFGFSGLLIPWDGMQTSIDAFRNKTGGNLTEDSVQFLRGATLVNTDTKGDMAKRWVEGLQLFARDSISAGGITASDGSSANNTSNGESKVMHLVHGIQAYVEQLSIPQSNTFMTVLLFFAIVLAAIIVGILLFKVILELWSLMGKLPHKLTSFRKNYWWIMAKTITNLILILYGVWTLYCVYQFTQGDSWAAKLLAALTLSLFTLVLAFFTFKIWRGANKFKRLEGDVNALFEDKEFWRKYSLFYDSYTKSYWWLFLPTIVYMFAKGCAMAAADGHALIQTSCQLIIESIMLVLLLWTRPYALKSGNWINAVIQVVRVISVVCILVFVEELGISQTTKSVTGVVLIVVQSVLTGVLALLIAINGIIFCCKENPHRRRRKAAERARDLDTLTPLHTHNSLLLGPTEYKGVQGLPMTKRASLVSPNPLNYSRFSRAHDTDESRAHLLNETGPMGHGHGRHPMWDRSDSPDPAGRQPTLPRA